ncbi:phosphatidate cytidylyltransferase [Haliovirga abyssi]|uniref:Phosphatidate cytidylyltransferase n=1 Tax=Haliovirga abyssi TaxID=2996794 RepID=A0AAU9D7X3_9FUSO|nr:phosphatidate cytidylyltransferase [Haliovirga abyssi]BDU49671.1 phosphatidate cytidylyltransferase [Haliovirga abyssi]
MKGRIIVAVIFIPLLIWIMLCGEYSLLLFVEVVVGVALYEFYKMFEKKDMNVYLKTGVIIGLLIPIFYSYSIWAKLKREKYAYFALVAIILYFMIKQVISGRIKEAISEISYTIFGVIYISFMFSHLLLLRYISNTPKNILGFNFTEGRLWILTIFLLIWASDSAAYFIGVKYGKHKIMPKVSPKKSVEGSIAGIIAPILSMILLKYVFFNELSFLHIILIGALVGIFGEFGDLSESLLKREFEIKDSGTILLGHGGIWDRFDSLIFAIPVLYYYLKFFVF